MFKRKTWKIVEIIPVADYPGHDWEFAKAYVLQCIETGEIKVRRV